MFIFITCLSHCLSNGQRTWWKKRQINKMAKCHLCRQRFGNGFQQLLKIIYDDKKWAVNGQWSLIDSPVSIGYFGNPIHMIAIWDCWKQITNVYCAIPERKSTSVYPLSWKKILKENKIFSNFSFMKVTIQRLKKRWNTKWGTKRLKTNSWLIMLQSVEAL